MQKVKVDIIRNKKDEILTAYYYNEYNNKWLKFNNKKLSNIRNEFGKNDRIEKKEYNIKNRGCMFKCNCLIIGELICLCDGCII